MRIAAIAATEAGLRVCCPVHDAFWVLAPDGEVESTVAAMRGIMVSAGSAVTGGFPITASVETSITSHQNLGDLRRSRGQGGMWAEVADLIEGGELRKAGG